MSVWVEAVTQDATIDLAKATHIETMGPGWWGPDGGSTDCVLAAVFGDRGTWFSVARGTREECEAERKRYADLLQTDAE